MMANQQKGRKQKLVEGESILVLYHDREAFPNADARRTGQKAQPQRT